MGEGVLRRAVWLPALAAAVCGWGAPPDFECHTRRAALREAVGGGVIVLAGGDETSKDIESARTPFFQEPNFYYLTGWKQPGARLLIDGHREILFLPAHRPDREKWTGPEFSAGDPGVEAASGFEMVLPMDQFESSVRAAGTPIENGILEKALARLRMTKSETELGLIQRSVDATVAAHLAAWKRAATGMYEYQIAAAMMAVYMDRGCERSAYAPIVASGPNALYLHYERNSRKIERGELLLMDVGAECAGYAADVTRTIPIDGKFTARQREIYEIVLGAQKAVIAAAKPGMTIGRTTPDSLYQIAFEYINSHGHDLHGGPLGKYLTHGISHHIGLEVHDAADARAPLAEGMVISVEPGIYIPEEQIGIRIEDMIEVTRTGGRLLTTGLPRETAEIEKILAK
jgi:Xaa-Pro aminopeptidase